MAENDSPTPAPEAAQQQATNESSSETPNVDSMLSALPGFDKYFGAEQSEGTSEPEESPGGETPPEEETEAVPAEQEGSEAVPEEQKAESPLQKRIDKLTAQKHEAMERAEAAEAKIKELETRVNALPTLAPTKDHPLSGVQTIPDLEQRLIDARRVKTWALENLDGGEVQSGEGTQELSGQQVKKLLAVAEEQITVHIPQRLQYLQSRDLHEAEAMKHYPKFFQTGTEEFQTLQKWVTLIPQVLNFPDFRLIIADALVGQRMRLAKNNAKNGAPAKTPPLAAPQPSSAPRTPQNKTVLSKDLLNRIATDRRALDIFSESLIGTGGGSRK